MSDKLMKIKDVCEHTTLSRSTIYTRIAQGTFPLPAKMGPRVARWVRSEIDQWIDEQIAKAR